MTSAAIRALTVRPVDLPLARPIETSAGVMALDPRAEAVRHPRLAVGDLERVLGG